MSRNRSTATEAELAEHYDGTRELIGFDNGPMEPVEVRRNVTISVRFSDEEIQALRQRADRAGAKVTAYIRAAALQQDNPVDRAELLGLLKDAADDVAQAERLLGA